MRKRRDYDRLAVTLICGGCTTTPVCVHPTTHLINGSQLQFPNSRSEVLENSLFLSHNLVNSILLPATPPPPHPTPQVVGRLGSGEADPDWAVGEVP